MLEAIAGPAATCCTPPPTSARGTTLFGAIYLLSHGVATRTARRRRD